MLPRRMKIRKFVALVCAITIFLCCLLIYHLTDLTLYLQDDTSHNFETKNWVHKRNKMQNEEIQKYAKTEKVMTLNADNKLTQFKKYNNSFWHTQKSICNHMTKISSADIQMFDLYKELKFDNLDGGVWKQGWNVQVSPGKWNEQNKLKVIIVPHSHNDPGWLKTFEDYYMSETRNILNNMLRKMSTDPKKKFIWAELSFLSLWWDELSQDDQDKVKKLVAEKQLEIVTGGWVMNDEANSHYYSIITQLTEGHQWMFGNFHTLPRNAWTIDPFGESPVMPYILRKMGLENLVIQRVHYSVKKYLAQTKNLEFRWKQLWDEGGENNLFTHMMPFYSYDIPHTCGPDPKICCQFDFKRLPGNGVSCPWGEPPKPIHKKNVAIRSQSLLDQYRKKAELYRTNVILVPLGDDFRYQYSAEWDSQFDNYYKIINYLNNNPSMYVNVKFGTLDDFFTALFEEAPVEDFPTLTGDFFTYADRADHYWSGYYTSRPYYKKMDRILIGYHRAAEIIYALSWGYNKSFFNDWLLSPQTGFAKMLRDIRRSLSLFQHHDGITGTARDNVMEDYARKMLEAINNSQYIIQHCSHFLLSPTEESYTFNLENIYFDFDDHRRNINILPERKVLIFKKDESKRLIFFNSLTVKRKEVVSFVVSTLNVQVLDSDDNDIPYQVSPVFSQGSVMDDTRYEIFFSVEVPAFGLVSYIIVHHNDNHHVKAKTLSKVRVFNSLGPLKKSWGFENAESSGGTEFSIENNRVKVILSANGLLKSMNCKETMQVTPLHLNFVRYLARQGKERSGAYLFLPEGEALIVRVKSPLIRVYEGPIYSRVEVFLSNVRHTLTLYGSPNVDNYGLEIVNLIDISNENNYELAMRITSHVMNKDEFYTDLNGFQMIKRKRFLKLPLQGNYYPMPTSAYIEDEKTRITIVSGQPLGVSSLKEGQLEILQDRRLNQDDNRGLGQGVLDNKPTPNIFKILVERRTESCKSVSGLLSPKSHMALQELLYPIIKMIWKPDTSFDLIDSFQPVLKDLDPDIHLVSARTMEEETKPSVGLIFLRQQFDYCFNDEWETPFSKDNLIFMDSFLPGHFSQKMWNSTLSLIKHDAVLDRKRGLPLCHMDFLSIILAR